MQPKEDPSFIVIDLSGNRGYTLRQKAVEFVERCRARGIEAGSQREQTYGMLAEIAIRDELGLPEIDPENHPISYDIINRNNVRIDVKCRGGTLPFQDLYEGTGGIQREAKHNFFARQVFDPRLDVDIYLMTHLRVPRSRTPLPGTSRQRSWQLYVCGWVSKVRVQNEGVYLPRGSVTEQGRRWFAYRAEEIEFYHRQLNHLDALSDILDITQEDMHADAGRALSLHLTSVDAYRIAVDMVGRGVLPREILEKLALELELDEDVPPFLHPNQYFHLIRWLKTKNMVTDSELQKLRKIFNEVKYEG